MPTVDERARERPPWNVSLLADLRAGKPVGLEAAESIESLESALTTAINQLDEAMASAKANWQRGEKFKARIAVLEAVLREAEEALKPFANAASYAPDGVAEPDFVIVVHTDEGRWTIHIPFNDFAVARTLAAKIATTLSNVPTGE